MKKSNSQNASKTGGFEWEMRAGGLLVQKRNVDSYRTPVPTIKISVKYDSTYHEIHISSHASFGELKKKLAEATGLHPQDQKLIYKDKERESRSFLDACGVKDGSKIVLVHDILGKEKRFLESRRNSSVDKALISVAEVSMEVDKLASKVAAMESVICKGGRVAEKELLALIELLMSQMIKLDAIVADGDVKLKRKTQVIRIQKYIDNLDRLKSRNSMPVKQGGGRFGLIVSQQQQRPLVVQQQREQRNFSSGQMNLTTKWEKF